jgi:hypothetical protein
VLYGNIHEDNGVDAGVSRAGSNPGSEEESPLASRIGSSIGGATIPTLNPNEEEEAEEVRSDDPATESVPSSQKAGRTKSNPTIIPSSTPALFILHLIIFS